MAELIETTLPKQHADPSAAVIPPRYWWLRRIAVGSALASALLFALRLWWGMVASTRLAAEIERHRAAGQPVLLADFSSEDSTVSSCGQLLQQAAAAVNLTPIQSQELLEMREDLNVVAQRLEPARAILAANRPALALVRRARTAGDGDESASALNPASAPALSVLTPQVRLNQLICLAAAYAHFSGDEAEAAELMHDHSLQATLIARSPFLLSEAMPSGSRPYALGPLEVLTPRLAIAPRDADLAGPARPANRERIDVLIRLLLDETSLRDSLRSFIYHERACELDMINEFAAGRATIASPGAAPRKSPPSLWDKAVRLPLRPMYELDAVQLLRYCSATAEASAASDWPTYLSQRPPDPVVYEGALTQFVRRVSSGRAPSFARSVRAFFRAIASRRMAATALGIRLYEVDHGRRPSSLEELVPDYLPVSPFDPFAGQDRILGYRPEGESPVLYSVGPDGRDDGGRPGDRQRRARGDDSGDMPFYLNGNRPNPRRPSRPAQPPPSTQADPNNQNVKDGQRQENQGDGGQSRP